MEEFGVLITFIKPLQTGLLAPMNFLSMEQVVKIRLCFQIIITCQLKVLKIEFSHLDVLNRISKSIFIPRL